MDPRVTTNVPKDRNVNEPFHYLNDGVSQSATRTQLIEWLGSLWNLECTAKERQHIASLIELLHTASLMIDYIQDSTSIRRGKPAAHHMYGTTWTIASAYNVVFERLQHEPNEIVAILLHVLHCMHQGQVKEVYWRDEFPIHRTVPTTLQYLAMVAQKTGSLFEAIPQLGRAFRGDGPDAMLEFYSKFGVYYQIRDDYMSLCSPSHWTKKQQFYDDCIEGKFGFPVILCIQDKFPGWERVLAITTTSPRTTNECVQCFEVLRDNGCLEATRDHLEQQRRSIRELIPSHASVTIPPIPPIPSRQEVQQWIETHTTAMYRILYIEL